MRTTDSEPNGRPRPTYFDVTRTVARIGAIEDDADRIAALRYEYQLRERQLEEFRQALKDETLRQIDEHGWSEYQAAVQAGVTRTTIRKWQGKKLPDRSEGDQ